MTIIEKFNSIDQTKLPPKVKEVLLKMKTVSKNFTIKEANEKIEPQLDVLIKKVEANIPDAIKSKSKVNKTIGGKKTTVESDPSVATTKKVTALSKEMAKLRELIKNDKVLQGFNVGQSNILIDSKVKAENRGVRVSKKGWKNQYGASKGGRKYYENRENRSDRYAPSFPKNKPFLASGGELMNTTQDMQQLGIANADFLIMADGGKTKSRKEDSPFNVDVYKSKLRLDNESPNSSKEFKTFKEAKEFGIDAVDDGNYQVYISSRSGYLWGINEKEGFQSYEHGGETKQLMDDSIINFDIPYALGGQTDLSSDSLDDITYEQGGETEFIARYKNNKKSIFADSIYDAQKKAVALWKIPKSKLFNLALMSKQSIENQDFRFLKKGGRTRNISRDQKFLNHSENWEETYSKGKEHRKGYMAKGGDTKKFKKGDKLSCKTNHSNKQSDKAVVGIFQKYNKNNTLQILLENGRKLNYSPKNCTKI